MHYPTPTVESNLRQKQPFVQRCKDNFSMWPLTGSCDATLAPSFKSSWWLSCGNQSCLSASSNSVSTYSKMGQQIYSVSVGETRNLQSSWSMVYNGMKRHTSSAASGASPSGPESTTAPSVDPPATTCCQESPFSCLINSNPGQKHK